jgi:phosphinothricin acetyltransferase
VHAAALTNRFIRDTAIHFGSHEQTDDEWRAMFDRQVGELGFPWLAAEVGGRFAGYAKSGVWRERAAYERTAEVAVYVEQAHQRCGVARSLYTRLFEVLAARDVHTVVAGATLPNDASVRLHEALGFTRVGTFREVGYKFGAYRDVAFFQRMLT